MHHRQLPKKLRQGVRRYDQYKWVATQGVDEASLLKELPKHLRRQIKRQLCLNLVRRVSPTHPINYHSHNKEIRSIGRLRVRCLSACLFNMALPNNKRLVASIFSSPNEYWFVTTEWYFTWTKKKQVPFFVEMDDRLLDSICERLKPTLWPAGMFIVREGDPLEEMLFIIRGHLDSYTTNGGRTGFFNSCQIQPGDFCGEELLTWALEPRPSDILPSSTRTVKATSDAEAFALGADDLKFVASQFRKLHSEQLRWFTIRPPPPLSLSPFSVFYLFDYFIPSSNRNFQLETLGGNFFRFRLDISKVYQSCPTGKTCMKGCEYNATTVTCVPLIDLLNYSIKFSSSIFSFNYKETGK